MDTPTEMNNTQRDLNRSLYRLGIRSGSSEIENRPLEIYLEITTHCNIRCVFCAREHDLGYLTGQRVGNIDRKFIDSISPFLETAQVVYPLGFGEPFLHREFLPIVERAKAAGAVIQFNTNGTLIEANQARRLVDARADTLVLSLDGARKETFEHIRAGASFDAIVSNMKQLDAIKRETGTIYPRVFVEFVAMISNFAELPDLVELSHEMGAVGVHVEPLVPHSSDLQDERIPSYDQEPFKSIVKRAVKRARDLNIGLVGRGITPELEALSEEPIETASPSGDIPRGQKPDHRAGAIPPLDHVITGLTAEDPDPETEPAPSGEDPINGSTSSCESPLPEVPLGPLPRQSVSLLCSQPFTTIYVGYKGRVGTCCLGNHELGDLNTQTLDEIWNGPRFQALRHSMRTGEVPTECRGCVEKGRMPPMIYNDEGLSIERPKVVYESATPPPPAAPNILLRLDILEARKVATNGELYLKVSFASDSSEPLHTEVHLEALGIEAQEPRPLLSPAKAVFPPGYNEVRSLRLSHNLSDTNGAFPNKIRISVRDAADGRTLIHAEQMVQT